MRDDQLNQRRQKIINQHREQMEALYKKLPDLARLDQELSQIRKEMVSRMLNTYRGQGPDPGLPGLEATLAEKLQSRDQLLKAHKIDESQLKPRWDCPRCEDTGRVYSEDDRVQTCACRLQQKSAWQQQLAGLPPRLREATFAGVNFQLYRDGERAQAQKLFSYVQRYCDSLSPGSKGHGLFIHGSTGSGKSWLLGCIANRLAPDMSVKYMVYADFLDTLRASFSSTSQSSEQELIEYVKQADLLLLDDLGVEKASEFSLKYLAQIIDYRYRNYKPVVVTSNFTLEELRNRTQSDLYGERIVWRLIETCDILNLEGNIRLRL